MRTILTSAPVVFIAVLLLPLLRVISHATPVAQEEVLARPARTGDYRSLASREEQLWSKDVRKNQSLQFILTEPQCEKC